jgi:hypothetical protein
MRIVAVCAFALMVSSCASVHQEDLQSWAGRPVNDLDKHPIFLTMQVVRTRTADGTEIRNYVNGRNTASCSGGGSVFSGWEAALIREHRPQSSSASLLTAGAFGFLLLIQCGEWPER